jgi:hypothetical protein
MLKITSQLVRKYGPEVGSSPMTDYDMVPEHLHKKSGSQRLFLASSPAKNKSVN